MTFLTSQLTISNSTGDSRKFLWVLVTGEVAGVTMVLQLWGRGPFSFWLKLLNCTSFRATLNVLVPGLPCPAWRRTLQSMARPEKMFSSSGMPERILPE